MENGNPTTATKDEKKITYIERNGRVFPIIEHFSDSQTYLDIIKNAMRREAECDATSM